MNHYISYSYFIGIILILFFFAIFIQYSISYILSIDSSNSEVIAIRCGCPLLEKDQALPKIILWMKWDWKRFCLIVCIFVDILNELTASFFARVCCNAWFLTVRECVYICTDRLNKCALLQQFETVCLMLLLVFLHLQT